MLVQHLLITRLRRSSEALGFRRGLYKPGPFTIPTNKGRFLYVKAVGFFLKKVRDAFLYTKNIV